AGLLKLNREEVGGAYIDPFYLKALCISAAGIDLINPEGETVCIRFAVEKVAIVLADEELRVVEWVEDGWDDRQRLPGWLQIKRRAICKAGIHAAIQISGIDLKI